MVAQCRPLIEVLAAIPDFRKERGKRHPLSAILGLACVATLCGYRTYCAIAEWGRNYGGAWARALGFTHAQTPCAATLHTIFRSLDRQLVEAKLGAWADEVLAAAPNADAPDEGIAIDGKTLRGSRKQGAPGVHLLSAVSHRLGLTLAQQAVDAKTNETTAIHDLLRGLALEGRVITMDALLTQRAVARTIVEAGGDYFMIVKGNQPQLQQDIQAVFADPTVLADTMATAETLDLGHGRIEHRRLTASTVLQGYSDWPGLQQVCQIERRVLFKRTGQQREEVVHAVTSFSPERAGPAGLLSCARAHWHIENRSHWVRDVTFDEDRSQVRCGNIPQVMAAVRNTVIGLMRSAGQTNIAAACRRFAAQPASALALIGIELEN